MSRKSTPSDFLAPLRASGFRQEDLPGFKPRPNPWDQIEAITDFETLRNFLIAHSGVFDAPRAPQPKDPS